MRLKWNGTNLVDGNNGQIQGVEYGKNQETTLNKKDEH